MTVFKTNCQMHKMTFIPILIKKLLLSSIPFAIIAICWIILHCYNVLPNWMIPSLTQTIIAFVKLLLDGTLCSLIISSTINSLPPYILGSSFAFLFGVLIGLNNTAKNIFLPFLSSIYPIPSIVWLPLIILFMGFTRTTVWIVIFISCFRKVIYNVIQGVVTINYKWILVAKNLEFSKIDIILKIILPGCLPHLFTGLRMGFASSWRSLIAAEMLVVSVGGLGKFIWMAQWNFDFDKVFCGVIIISIIGIIVEKFMFGILEKHTLMKWGIVYTET